jgi:hypothetical protein
MRGGACPRVCFLPLAIGLGQLGGRPCQEAGWACWERERTTKEKGEKRIAKEKGKRGLILHVLNLTYSAN